MRPGSCKSRLRPTQQSEQQLRIFSTGEASGEDWTRRRTQVSSRQLYRAWPSFSNLRSGFWRRYSTSFPQVSTAATQTIARAVWTGLAGPFLLQLSVYLAGDSLRACPRVGRLGADLY